MMTVVTGGSASGKSAFAENLLLDMGEKRRIYAATMIAWDEECRARIQKHRRMRKSKKFETLECPVDLERAGIPEDCAVLLECMSNLAANELYREDMESSADAACSRILCGVRHVRNRAEDLVVVTNDVFCDTGGYGEETENYLALLGRLNRELFSMADEVYEVVCGIPVCLKGAKRAGSDTGITETNIWKEKIPMKVITGGAYQGKLEFAKTFFPDQDMKNIIADGAADELEAAFAGKIVDNFQEYVRRLSGGSLEEARERVLKFTKTLIERNPGAVVVADEIGCGIVPMNPGDRQWRDLTGEAVKLLSGEASAVYRVVGGIPVVLKGGDE